MIIMQIGQLAERILRCLNNLDQRLNLSFMYYIPIGFQRFVSIGQYLGPAFGLIFASLLWHIGSMLSYLDANKQKQATIWSTAVSADDIKQTLLDCFHCLLTSVFLFRLCRVVLAIQAQSLEQYEAMSSILVPLIIFKLLQPAKPTPVSQKRKVFLSASLGVWSCLWCFVICFSNAPIGMAMTLLSSLLALCASIDSQLMTRVLTSTFLFLAIACVLQVAWIADTLLVWSLFAVAFPPALLAFW